MDNVLIVLGILLFIAWMGGLIVSLPPIWKKIIGDISLKYKFKRPLHIKRSNLKIED